MFRTRSFSPPTLRVRAAFCILYAVYWWSVLFAKITHDWSVRRAASSCKEGCLEITRWWECADQWSVDVLRLILAGQLEICTCATSDPCRVHPVRDLRMRWPTSDPCRVHPVRDLRMRWPVIRWCVAPDFGGTVRICTVVIHAASPS